MCATLKSLPRNAPNTLLYLSKRVCHTLSTAPSSWSSKSIKAPSSISLIVPQLSLPSNPRREGCRITQILNIEVLQLCWLRYPLDAPLRFPSFQVQLVKSDGSLYLLLALGSNAIPFAISPMISSKTWLGSCCVLPYSVQSTLLTPLSRWSFPRGRGSAYRSVKPWRASVGSYFRPTRAVELAELDVARLAVVLGVGWFGCCVCVCVIVCTYAPIPDRYFGL